MERMRKRKGELDLQIASLADGLAMGIHSPTIMVEITKREREVSEISDRLLSSRPESIHSRIEKLRTTVIVRIPDLRKISQQRHGDGASSSHQTRRSNRDGTDRQDVRGFGELELIGRPTLGRCRGREITKRAVPLRTELVLTA
jgi:hypothetical protein